MFIRGRPGGYFIAFKLYPITFSITFKRTFTITLWNIPVGDKFMHLLITKQIKTFQLIREYFLFRTIA